MANRTEESERNSQGEKRRRKKGKSECLCSVYNIKKKKTENNCWLHPWWFSIKETKPS